MAEKKRAVEFSQPLFDRICDRLADGMSLRAVCTDESMPDRRTFRRWCDGSPELQAQYDEACRAREEHYFDEIIDIADECRPGIKTVTKQTATGTVTEITEIDMVERARVQIDARKWALARMNRKKYGDKMGIDGGEDGSAIKVVYLNKAPAEELPE